MKNDKILSMLGIARKAGKLACGQAAVENAVKSGRASAVIVAADASHNTQKLFINMCEFYNVPYYIYSGKDEIGHAIGREFCASAAVLDGGLANALNNKFIDLDSAKESDRI